MPDINRVMIAGNLTRDPSFRQTSQQTPVVNFCVASNRKYKDQNGQWREEVCYVGVVAWHKLAESCGKNLTRGSAVLVDGELQSRLWKSEDGDARTVVEIKAHRVQFLDKPNRNETPVTDDDASIENAPSESWSHSEN
ncbi:single-stranded DNA-binding protein [bacterium]|nr:single-stranded DNA-binding protein [bacterium]